jgi:DNA-binding transcriptional LysR family regulator
MRCDSPEAVKASVKTKMGIGILFQETVELDVKSGEFKVLKLPDQNFEGRSFLVYRKDQPLSLHAQEFLDLMRQRQHSS